MPEETNPSDRGSTLLGLAQQIAKSNQDFLNALKADRQQYIEAAQSMEGLAVMGFTPFRRLTEEAQLLKLFDANKEFRTEVRTIMDKYIERSKLGPDHALSSNGS